jgi:outer membrane protein
VVADHSKIDKEEAMNLRTGLRVAAFSLACLLGATAHRGQNASAGATSTKFGVINVLQVIGLTAEGKLAVAELQLQFVSRQQEVDSLNKRLTDLQQRLKAGGSTLGEEEKSRLNAQATRLAKRLDNKQTEYQEDLKTAQEEVVNSIGRKMISVLERYAQENSYAAVFDSGAQNSPVLYASDNIDLTKDIIRLYDQTYPVKGTGTTPTTRLAPAPKPETPPSPKP